MPGVAPEVLGRLVDENAAALVLYARQWCAAAEDVVQEAFLKLVKQKSPPDNPVAWLYRVVRNTAVSATRSAQRRLKHEAIAAGRMPEWFASTEGAEIDAAAAGEALQALPLEQREVIVAYLWGGLTFEQIAGLSGSSASTAHRWYAAGLATLRERLGVACPGQQTLPKTRLSKRP